jgi:hypothetical protein
MSSSVIIIGGGLAGPVAALRLTQAGYKCIVYQRSPSAQTMGGAVNLAPNRRRLLDRLGVLEEILQQGCIVDSLELRPERGAVLGYLPNSSADGYSGVRIMRFQPEHTAQAASEQRLNGLTSALDLLLYSPRASLTSGDRRNGTNSQARTENY